MKFEQAFYTFGLNQLSKYKEGLGICAASRLDPDFLDQCLSLGGHFDSEYTQRTAEFTLYSQEFRDFVGVGISPKENGGDGRTNKLCHFFIPAESGHDKEPEHYILDYPFRREVTEHEEIAQADLEPAVYEYHGILEKYSLHGFKLAVLLWRVYACVFAEVKNLRFIIDKTKHETDEYGQIAREITWLVSVLLPVPDRNRDLYRSRISYGVYTNENVREVRFLFTDEEGQNTNLFFIDSQPQPESRIPRVYEVMAEWAEESREGFQKKLRDMMQWKFSKKLQSDQLLLMYFRWRLEKNEDIVSFDEIQSEMEHLLLRAKNSSWHKEFLIKYLKQEERMNGKRILSVWTRFICPEMESYGSMRQEEKQQFAAAVTNLVCMMRGQSRKNYHLFLEDLSETAELENQVLHNICLQEEGKNYILEELKECETAELFCRFASRYSSICGEDGLKAAFWQQACLLYGSSCRADRGSISKAMNKQDQKAWEKEMQRYISNDFKGLDSYLNFLENEMDKIEAGYAYMYYAWLLYFAERHKNGEVIAWRIVREKEKELQKVGEILESDISKLNDCLVSCEEEEVVEQIRRDNLEGLAEWKTEELKYDVCKEVWIQCMTEKLRTADHDQKESISNELFQKLVYKVADIASWGAVYKEKLFDYINCLKKTAESDGKRSLQIHFAVCGLGSEKRNLPDFWKNISQNDFEELYEILKKNQQLYHIDNSDELSEKGVFVRGCYLVWECMKENKEISTRTYYDGHVYREDWRGFVKECKKTFLGKDDPTQKDTYNFIALQILYEQAGERSTNDRGGLCRKIRKLREKHPSFAKAVQRGTYYGEDEKATRRWTDMKVFLDIMEYTDKELQESDINDVGRLLEHCPHGFENEMEVKELVERYKEMIELQRENADLKEEAKNLRERNQNLQDEKQNLESANQELTGVIKQLFDRIERLENKVAQNTKDIQENRDAIHRRGGVSGEVYKNGPIKKDTVKDVCNGSYEEGRLPDSGRSPEINEMDMRKENLTGNNQIEASYMEESCFTASRNDVKSGKYARGEDNGVR